MNEIDGVGPENDTYLEKLRAARSRPAVLKLEFIQLRQLLPATMILVFEGDDDKIVYFQWIMRVRPELEYEPLPCKGKKNVLSLRDSLLRDRSDLSRGVYFFVDRDFDDLMGYDPHPTTFMTDCYSTENYLVDENVLSLLLRDEFHCHARPDIRQRIVERFVRSYSEFMEVTKEVNMKIFLSRRLGLSVKMPDKLKFLAKVRLGKVEPPNEPSLSLKLEREPTAEEIAQYQEEFLAMEPRLRYRGKFALMFFEKWLNDLADEHAGNIAGTLFDGLERSSNVRRSEISLGGFASKSSLPRGFREFVCAMEFVR